MTKKEKEKPDPIEVPLGTSGLFAWIDQEDEDLLVNNWDVLLSGTHRFPQYYAIYRLTINKITTTYYMHNEVWEKMMDIPVPPGFLIDHINGDKLDNRRCNLRLATRTENEANKKKRRTQKNQIKGQPTSKYKGVSKIRGRKKCWRACIGFEGEYKSLGTYYSEEEAAQAYNKAAVELFGEFALLNKIEDIENIDDF